MHNYRRAYKAIEDHMRLYKIIQDYRRPYKIIVDHMKLCKIRQDYSRPYKTIQDQMTKVDHMRLYKTIHDYRVAFYGNLSRTAGFSCQPVSQIDTAYRNK